MARPKTRNRVAKRRGTTPHPPAHPEARLTSQAARDARIRRQIRDGLCNPKRPPAPCTLDPVAAAKESAVWRHILANYLWAYSADTWEDWHASYQNVGVFWGSARGSLTQAVEQLHNMRHGHISMTSYDAERPMPGSANHAAWLVVQGIHPSVRDVVRQTLVANRRRTQLSALEIS